MKLLINGNEVWFDPYKLLDVQLVAEHNGEIMGPIRVTFDADKMEIHGNEEQNEGVFIQYPRGELKLIGNQQKCMGFVDSLLELEKLETK